MECNIFARLEIHLTIEHLYIHSNENDTNYFCNFSDIMLYLCHIVVPTQEVVLQFASFLKGKDTSHIRMLFISSYNNHLASVFKIPCFYQL